MRRLLPLLLTLALAGCATTSTSQSQSRTKGFEESRSTAEALDASFAPRKVAVVVGVGTFADEAFPALKWAEDDALAVGRILEDAQYGGFDRVVYLTGASQVRRDRVLAELVALKNDLRRQDTLVVYVSTHGTMTIDAAGEPRLYLVAGDTRPADLRGTAIELAELQRFFSDMRAERKALILDACYNGEAKSALQPTIRQRVERMEAAPVLSRNVRLGESEAHLFASTFGRPAREDDELKAGVYTYHLLDALTWNQQAADSDSDGVVTVYEAHDHARRGTLAYTLGVQVPEAYFRVVGHNDVVLVGAPEARAKAELGAVYWYGPSTETMDGATLLIDGEEKGVLPGTFPVTPGRHRVKVVGHDGSLLQDRVVTIGVGEAIPAETLRQRPVVHNGFLTLGPKARFTPAAAARPLLGRAHVGAELSGGYRFMGGIAGLTLGAGLGYAPHQARFVDGDGVRYVPRHAVWSFVQVGYRGLLNRGTLGAAYRLRLTGITALPDVPPCIGEPTCDAWVWPTQALAFDQTVTLGKRWSLYVEEEIGLSVLDVDGEGAVAIPDFALRVGVQVGL